MFICSGFGLLKQVRHLLLCKPNGIFLRPDFDLSISGPLLVNEHISFVFHINFYCTKVGTSPPYPCMSNELFCMSDEKALLHRQPTYPIHFNTENENVRF